MFICTCLSVLPLEGARTLRCTLMSLSWNLFVPREYYIRRLCGRMFAVLLYRDTWGRLLAEICVDKLWFFHAQWRVLWIRMLSGFFFLTSAPGLGRRIDILLLSPRCSITAATVGVLSCWFRWLPVCPCLYVCVSVCPCLYVCVCVCLCVYVCLCLYVCIYVCLCVCIYVCACVCVCMNVCAFICVCVCVFVYVCPCL